MIEWKTSTRTKANIAYTYDNPVQLAAYTGAYNLMPDQDKLVRNYIIFNFTPFLTDL